LVTKNKIPPWMFGNTTVRSPFRLKDGLIAISQSSLQGNLRGVEQDKAFRDLLGEIGIVELGTDATNSVGRKWRVAMSQLGFLYPPLPEKLGIAQSEIGAVDTITPNGWRLINSEAVSAIQECFLRSLASYYVPNTFEKNYDFKEVFSPLRLTLKVMLELEKRTNSSVLNIFEMAVIVQFSNADYDISVIVNSILHLRNRRDLSKNKKKFIVDELEIASEKFGYVPGTFKDYADTNFRYLKATGLVQSKGSSITIIPEKHLFVQKLCEDSTIPLSDKDWLLSLTNGSILPTDNKDLAILVVDDLRNQLSFKGVKTEKLPTYITEVADINQIRFNLEDKLFQLNEIEYASNQANQWEEISSWMEILSTNPNKAINLESGERLSIPQGEAPAYFEWIIWRAFLAINSLINPPNDSRKFKIDQDFLPVGTAPGGGPDLIFEFENFVIVGEVTLTTNSRQEAAEGEPVRRHVANIVDFYADKNKRVYGLFLANRIDSNTAETFRLGTWYRNDDIKIKLDIIPLPLSAFKKFFDSMFISNKIDSNLIEDLITKCSVYRDNDAPIWKNLIVNTVNSYSENLLSH
jgi:hypothetical protein